MTSRFVQRSVKGHPEYSNSFLLRDPNPNPLNELCHSAPWRTDREENGEQGDALGEQLQEMDEHVARLQDMLRCERTKCTHLQLRCNQLEAELRRREQQSIRLKERLSQQLSVRHKEKGSSIEVLNFPPGGRSRREQPIKSFVSTAKREEAVLRLMLERREAELREAMKLRHSLTTLLHALRVNMEQTLSDSEDVEDEVQHDDKILYEAEVVLGDHVTGGVVQSWRKVQRRLGDVQYEGHTGDVTDQDKLLAQLGTELRESQQLVRLQQQMLQGDLASPRRTFERERQSFTDAAIRLSHERRDFEQQKASLVKQQYLCDSSLCSKGAPSSKRRDGTALNFSGLGPTSISGCLPITPSSVGSGSAALSVLYQGRVTVQTPSTPELYEALNLSYNCRSIEVDPQSETWDCGTEKMVDAPQASHLDWSF
ncbi:unnamed protein product [Pleuronectes platessa]|uniref:Uncharacterized protein n=1 Tax=Pleuronectes platessa TaxID=8262 RepID=A0A9N7YCM2_PLEPL|nr:unnamed protein product [Pleuronectes platessa]